MFNTKIWLLDAVRTSEYVYPDNISDLGSLDININELVDSLAKINDFDLPALSGALLPARLPKNILIPDCIFNNWDSFAASISVYAGSLHPMIKHLILGLALHDSNQDVRLKRLEAVKSLYLEGTAYQPTITWTSLLCSDWYTDAQKIVPSIRGGNVVDSNKGVSVSLILTKDKIRVNPATLFTSTNTINVKDAHIMSASDTWNEVALVSKSLDYPLITSNWLYALASKEAFWEDVSVGGALYSPYYADTEIDKLTINHSNEQGPGFYFRPGNGISDIYPIQQDPVLSAYFDAAPLFDSPFWTGMACSIMNLISHPGSPVGLPLNWCVDLLKELQLTESMDILPAFSAFSEIDTDGKVVKSDALDALTALVDTKDPTYFGALLKALLVQQQKLSSMYDGVFMDAAATGYPHSFKHFLYSGMKHSNPDNASSFVVES